MGSQDGIWILVHLFQGTIAAILRDRACQTPCLILLAIIVYLAMSVKGMWPETKKNLLRDSAQKSYEII